MQLWHGTDEAISKKPFSPVERQKTRVLLRDSDHRRWLVAQAWHWGTRLVALPIILTTIYKFAEYFKMFGH